MHYFEYQNRILHCEDIPLTDIATAAGTPCYVYSYKTLRRHFTVFDESLQGVDRLICYSMKANSNLAVLKLFINLGSGVDIVSSGELFRALRAGADPRKIVFSGVGKSDEEILEALQARILMFNVESSGELERIQFLAAGTGQRAGIALRVNPDIDAQTHPYISTGLKSSKFGIPIQAAEAIFARASQMPNIEVLGVDCHIGSQITETTPFIAALERIKALIHRLRDHYCLKIRYLDLGGGLGITYDEETPPHPTEYAREILAQIQDLNCTLILEPGRVLVGNAGILLTKVLYLKENEGKQFVIVDAGMNDLIRPSLYGAYQKIVPVIDEGAASWTVDVVGPICESGDFLARDREMPVVQPGDLLAVMSSGAYGYVMASQYNSHPRPAEILVRENRMAVVRERETHTDLIRGEKLPDFDL